MEKGDKGLDWGIKFKKAIIKRRMKKGCRTCGGKLET